MSSAEESIGLHLAELYRIPEQQRAIDWIPANMLIPDDTESPGLFDLSLFPHVAEVFNLADSVETEEIILIWSTRNGKTFGTISLIPFWAVTKRKPVGFASADGKNLEDNITKKLYPMLDKSAATSEIVPPEHARNSKEVMIGQTTVYLANAKSKNSLANFPAQLVVCNEVGLWPLNSVQRIRQRLRNFRPTAKAIFEGKPETRGHCTISALAASSDVQRRIRHVRCPHCGVYQPLVWGWGKPGPGLKWEKLNGRSNEQHAIKTAFYECVSGCRVDSEQRPEMMRSGVWVPEGQHVRPDGTLSGSAAVESVKRVALMRLSALYSLMIAGWGQIVSEWFEVKDDKELIREFVTGTLATEYDPVPRTLEPSVVAGRLADPQLTLGLFPAWASFGVVVVDCGVHGNSQELEFFWQAQAWGMVEDRTRGHVCEFGYVFGEESLKTFLKQFTFTNYSGKESRPVKIGIDSGDGHVSAKIYNLCDELNKLTEFSACKVIPLKGDSRSDTAPGWYTHGFFDSRKKHELILMKQRGDCDFILIRTSNSQSWRESITTGLIDSTDKDWISLPKEMAESPEEFEPFLKQLTADYFSENKTWERSGKNEQGDLLRYGRALASVHTTHDKYWQRVCRISAPAAPSSGTAKQSPESDPFAIVGNGVLVSLFERSIK